MPLHQVQGFVPFPAELVSRRLPRLADPPPPLRFDRNRGADYIPCLITLPGGRQALADYVRVIMEMDPQVVGRMEGDDQDYAGPLHATPDFTVDRPHYLADNLHRFRSNTDKTALFDAALEYINDRTLSTEVYRYRQASSLIAILRRDINRIQQRMWEVGALLEGSSRRLEAANALDRIEEAVVARQQRQAQQALREEQRRQNGVQAERAERRGRRS